MKWFSALLLFAAMLSAAGCGSSAQGPAKPEDTPVVTAEEVGKKYTSGMPPEYMKKYSKYGGAPGGATPGPPSGATPSGTK
jgi:hypothetical protein